MSNCGCGGGGGGGSGGCVCRIDNSPRISSTGAGSTLSPFLLDIILDPASDNAAELTPEGLFVQAVSIGPPGGGDVFYNATGGVVVADDGLDNTAATHAFSLDGDATVITVLDQRYNANSVEYAVTDNTPVNLQFTPLTVLGMGATGNLRLVNWSELGGGGTGGSVQIDSSLRISSTGDGSAPTPFLLDLILDPAIDNAASLTPDGLFVESVPPPIGGDVFYNASGGVVVFDDGLDNTAATHAFSLDGDATVITVLDQRYNANSVEMAVVDNTPVNLQFTPTTVLGMGATGNARLVDWSEIGTGGGGGGGGVGATWAEMGNELRRHSSNLAGRGLAPIIGGETPVHQVFAGDSVLEGAYGNWLVRYRKTMARYNRGRISPGWVATATGYLNLYRFAHATGYAGTTGGLYTSGGGIPAGLNLYAYQMAVNEVLTFQEINLSTLTYTHSARPFCDEIWFAYTAQGTGGGSLVIKIDGVTVQTIVTHDAALGAGATDSGRLYKYQPGIRARRGITVTCTGSTSIFDGAYISDQDRVWVWNGGHVGKTTADYVNAIGHRQAVNRIDPDLYVDCLGINDNSTTAAYTTDKTNLHTLIAGQVPDVSYVILTPYATEDNTNWQSYVDAAEAVATANNLIHLNLFEAMGNLGNVGDIYGLSAEPADPVHVNFKGGEFLGSLVAGALDGHNEDYTHLACPTYFQGAHNFADFNVNTATQGLTPFNFVSSRQDDLVLLTAQTDPLDNGLYIAHPGPWERAPGWKDGDVIPNGMTVQIVNEFFNARYLQTSNEPTVGTHLLNLIEATTAAGGRSDSGTFQGAHNFADFPIDVATQGLTPFNFISASEGDRILLTAQTNNLQNGMWISHAGAWTPAPGWTTGSIIASGTTIQVVNSAFTARYMVTNTTPPIIGTTAVTFRYESVPVLVQNVVVAAAANVNIATQGLGPINFATIAEGDRVLLTNQSVSAQNGVWIAHSGAWTQAPNWKNGDRIPLGTIIQEVNNLYTWRWRMTNYTPNNGPLVGTDTLIFINDNAVNVAYQAKHLTGTATWDPPSVINGAIVSTTVTVTGAAVGNVTAVGHSVALPAGMVLSGSVTATNTVTVTLVNHSGGTLDIASGTLRADVWLP